MDSFESRLDACLYRHRPKIKKLSDALEKRKAQGLAFDRKEGELQRFMEQSIETAFTRMQSIPNIEFPENLPISAKREEIAELIQKNQVLILAGETGSGKTTQIPKICLSIGRGVKGLIGHTQPRRIAARTVASRIAEELKVELGTQVGYQVRFTDHSSPNSLVKLMTDGVLLAEIQQDPLLLKYDTLIIDEAHERSLNIDFLLGYLKGVLKKRPELKLIVTSATIDLERFSKHFDDAPVMEVSGRTFPVDVIYRPWQEEFEDLSEAIVGSIGDILTMSKGEGGDILVFLSGEREIREASHAIKKAGYPHLDILPLYARLSLAEQSRVFHSHKGRRVVLATNVAETSLTVPGIRFVIDPGTARISRYSLRTKVQRLPIEPVSQASANQRKGRCGRVSDGICIRLYDEEDFNNRPEFTDAEILRTNLAAVILQMLQLRIGDVRKFPFVDRPDNKLINDGFKLLEELKAVNARGQISEVGRNLSKLPLDPKLARTLLEAKRWGCLKEILIIVSALTIQDPRERPADKQQASDEKHRRFWDEQSDFIAYINLWNYVEEQRQELSQNQLRKLCQREFLNFLRLKEWRDLHHQLRLAVKDLNLRENQEPASYESIHRALLVGYLSNAGLKNEEKNVRDYFGTRNKKFIIFPGSSQNKKRPKWVFTAEFIETSQLYGHCVAKVEPHWILECADHLVKYHYFEPHYSVKAGQVKAFAKISLFGLILQEKKKVNYSKVDPTLSREIFIRAALVEGFYRGKGAFFQKNQEIIENVTKLEAKSRRRDILADEQVIFDHYNAIVPENIVNLTGFEHWRKAAEQENPELLVLSQSQIQLHNADGVTENQFPDTLHIEGMQFPLSYRFEPGNQDDGVNIEVPVDLLHAIPPAYLEWLVPGFLRDKCTALLKGLPKVIRKRLVPVPQYVDKVLPRLKPGNMTLCDALSQELKRLENVDISEDDWAQAELDNFYRMNVLVLDENGKVIDRGRSLDELRLRYREQVQQSIQSASNDIEKEELKAWDFGCLEPSVELDRGSVRVKAYPAIINKSTHVDLRVMDNPYEAEYESHIGIVRLGLLNLAQSHKYLTKNLLKGKDIGLAVVNIGKRDRVADDIVMAAVNDACFSSEERILDKAQFEKRLEKGRHNVVGIAQNYERCLLECLDLIVKIKKLMKSSKNALAMTFTFIDINTQIERLFYKGFIFDVPYEWFEQYPRYLNAILVRLEKAPANPKRDKQYIGVLDELWEQHQLRLDKEGQALYASNDEWQQYRWMLEELRVSYFAQTLKTKLPVSEKRIKTQWESSI